jgi:hypothetical protein
MTKSETFFKVVYAVGSHHYSANSCLTPEKRKECADSCLVYKIGKVTTPKIKGSKLFAFKTLEAARSFISGGGSEYKIFKCVGTNPTNKKRMPVSEAEYIDTMRAFWSRKLKGSLPVPRGTVFCDTIELTKRVK